MLAVEGEAMNEREAKVARTDDLKDGEMRQVAVQGTEILLVRIDGRFHAIGAHCTHYGAPLVDGVLCGRRVVCPWHHACFDVTTGDLEEPPALDALPRYQTRIEDGHIIVSLPEDVADRRVPQMSRRAPNDARLFIILGGGAAGYMAAQTLREDGFTGRILLVSDDGHLPYDRPNLSKDYLAGNLGADALPLRSEEFFREHEIEIELNRKVARVEAANKIIRFSDGASLRYDALLVATGGEPRTLPAPGADLGNVFTLRNRDDAERIIASLGTARRAAVIGASFIGMETASSLAARGLSVTVVAPESVPFEHTLGAEIGALFQKLHEENGVRFKLGAKLARFEGQRRVEAVILESGERIEADLVIVGAGVKPATEFLEGVEKTKDGRVVVDNRLRAAEDLYAAGDIASFPDARTGERVHIEHWRTAMQQGRVAAHNMAGHEAIYASVPFFWTQQFGLVLGYVGHAPGWDELLIWGSIEARDFLAFYARGGRVLAAAGVMRDRELAAVEELMRLDRLPSAEELRRQKIDLAKLLQA